LKSNGLLALLAATALVAGCRQDMHDAPRYEAFEASSTFADNRASRTPPAGTVARGWLRDDEALYTGKINGQVATEFPMPVTKAVLDRGQERFNVYCSPCHGRTGEGNGMIVQRGFRQPPSYHEERLRNAPVGYFFDVMTNGFGAMPDYRAQVPVADRWRIVAYIRALQLSHYATTSDMPEAELEKLRAADAGAPAAAPATPPAGHD